MEKVRHKCATISLDQKSMDDASESKRAMELMLSDFYGLDDNDEYLDEESSFRVSDVEPSRDRSPSPSTTAVEKRSSNLDAERFDVNLYISGLLSKRSPSALIEADNTLRNDIRSLDSDMQTLVYDNYNKFISATDTIRDMNGRVESMDADMSQLNSSIVNITKETVYLSETFAPNRARISRLAGIKQLLTNLGFLFELPQRLTTAIEQGNYAQAVSEIKLSIPYLERHSQIPSLKKIHEETVSLVQSLKVKLRDILGTYSKSSISEQLALAELLIDLGESSVVLCKDTLDSRRTGSLARLLTKNPELSPTESIAFLNNECIAPLIQMLRESSRIFLKSAADIPLVRKYITSFTREVFQVYLDRLRTEFTSIMESIQPETITYCLQTLSDDILECTNIIQQLSTSTEDSFLLQALSVVTTNAFTECIRIVFRFARTRYIDQLMILVHEAEISSAKLSRSPEIGQEIFSVFVQVSKEIKPLIALRCISTDISRLLQMLVCDSVSDLIGQLLCGHAMHTYPFVESHRACCERLLDYTKTGSHIGVSMLLFQELATFMSKTGVELIFRCFELDIPGFMERCKFPIRTLNNDMFEASQAIRRAYCETWARKLQSFFVLHIESNSSPSSISDGVVLLCSNLQTMCDEVSSILQLDASSRQLSTRTSIRPRVPRRQGQQDFNLDIERLFAQEVQVFTELPCVGPLISACVYRALFKFIIEVVRERMYISKFDLQQLQIDVFALQVTIPSSLSLDSREALDSLVDEILNSALGRCEDLEPCIEAYEVESIVRPMSYQ